MSFYGTRLSETHGLQCPPDWAETVDAADNKALSSVMVAIRREHLHHPPTLGEFEDALEKATRTPAPARGGPSVAEMLCTYAVANNPLTQAQLAAKWTYLSRQSWVKDKRSDPTLAVEILGVVIPADPEGQRPSYRIMVEDMDADQVVTPPPRPPDTLVGELAL